MVAINFGNVLSRYFIHASWSFSEELMVILFVYNCFLGASVAYKRGAHLGFTVLTDLFPPSKKILTIYFTGIVTVALLVVLAWFGVKMVQSQILYGQKTPALGWPEWVAGISVPFGSLLIILRVIQFHFNQIKEIYLDDENEQIIVNGAN